MIVIAEFYARYKATLAEAELRLAAENLLRFAERTTHDYYAERYDQLGITISVRVEIGSSRVWITLKALGKALIVYASVRQGIDYLVQDPPKLARLIVPGIPTVLKLPAERPEYHARRLGLPGQLRRLFMQVELGELSADEATNRAVLLLQKQEETDVIAMIGQQLSAEFHEVERSLSRRPGEAQSSEQLFRLEATRPPEKAPSLPQRREPVLAPPPGTNFRRRRRRVVVATRDLETGDVRINMY